MNRAGFWSFYGAAAVTGLALAWFVYDAVAR